MPGGLEKIGKDHNRTEFEKPGEAAIRAAAESRGEEGVRVRRTRETQA